MSVRDKIAAFGCNNEAGSGIRTAGSGGSGAPTWVSQQSTRVNQAPSSSSSTAPRAGASDHRASQAVHNKPAVSTAFGGSRKAYGASPATESHQPSSSSKTSLDAGGAGAAAGAAFAAGSGGGGNGSSGQVGNGLASEAGSKRSVGGSARSAASNGAY